MKKEFFNDIEKIIELNFDVVIIIEAKLKDLELDSKNSKSEVVQLIYGNHSIFLAVKKNDIKYNIKNKSEFAVLLEIEKGGKQFNILIGYSPPIPKHEMQRSEQFFNFLFSTINSYATSNSTIIADFNFNFSYDSYGKITDDKNSKLWNKLKLNELNNLFLLRNIRERNLFSNDFGNHIDNFFANVNTTVASEITEDSVKILKKK